MNLILIGQRGAGKTSAGRIAASRAGAPFLDTDEEVERIFNKSVSLIFAEEGEAAFRDAERKAVERVQSLDGHVISVGGGACVDPDNRRILRSAGIVVWLRASPRALLSRRRPQDRPPLTDLPLKEEIEFLSKRRGPVYGETAHLTVDTDPLDLEEVARELERIWREFQ